MAFTFGFYDSIDHDRRYNAIEMSEIFDGLIGDGIYETIGQAFKVSASEGTEITVGTGRAWFNHTWNLNDSIMILDCGRPELLLDRIDAVVIEVDRRVESRSNSIKVIKGIPGQTPTRPSMDNGIEDLYWHPLAYIYRTANKNEIGAEDITNAIGTSECPFVIGIIKTMEIDFIVEQWAAQWNSWLEKKQYSIDVEWQEWFDAKKTLVDQDFYEWINGKQHEFVFWFENLQALLEGDVAANLANQILEINEKLDTLAEKRIMYQGILDSDGDPILCEPYGDPLIGLVKFCVEPCCGERRR